MKRTAAPHTFANQCKFPCLICQAFTHAGYVFIDTKDKNGIGLIRSKDPIWHHDQIPDKWRDRVTIGLVVNH